MIVPLTSDLASVLEAVEVTSASWKCAFMLVPHTPTIVSILDAVDVTCLYCSGAGTRPTRTCYRERTSGSRGDRGELQMYMSIRPTHIRSHERRSGSRCALR